MPTPLPFLGGSGSGGSDGVIGRAAGLSFRQGGSSSSRGLQTVRIMFLIPIGVFVVCNILLLRDLFLFPVAVQHDEHGSVVASSLAYATTTTTTTTNKATASTSCELRRYPPHRYYGFLDGNNNIHQAPAFLTTETEYIFGSWPTILATDQSSTTKICINQSEWLPKTTTTATTTTTTMLPFADGTNPSIVTMARLRREAPSLAANIVVSYPGTKYVATACMTNSQCQWQDSVQQMMDFRLSSQREPDTVRTVLLLLGHQPRHDMRRTTMVVEVLAQATIYMHRDAPWGRQYPTPVKDISNPDYVHLPALDDARLFLHNGLLFVSYREGRGFGWDAQVLNPIHVTFHGLSMQAIARASETSKFCCGRNMALMADIDNAGPTPEGRVPLLSLTWVDPVTVISVETTPLAVKSKPKGQQSGRRRRRRLESQEEKSKKSHIHGTNAFMVPLPILQSSGGGRQEYLGVAHFHRPNDRKTNQYARFGHHYTHAFYTIQRRPNTTTGQGKEYNDRDDAKKNLDFRLVSITAEFVLPASYTTSNAEIIQFISGLEYDPDTDNIVLAYGINDCEAALTTIPLPVVRRMLRPVPDHEQVVDLMMPLVQTAH